MTDDAWKVSTLRGLDMFRGIPTAGLATLAQHGRRRTFQAGSEVFRRGDVAESLYVIATGRVRVELEHPELTAPVVAYVGAGELLGQEGLLDGDRRSATVTALVRCEAIELPAHSLAELALRFRNLSGPLLTRLSRRFHTVDDLAEELSGRTAR